MKTLRAPSLLSIAWPFLSVVLLLTSLAVFSLDTLSASRAFASGESLWSKAQKRAVHCLRQHALNAGASDRACFDDAMAVPMGILRAHRALTSPAADREAASQGLLSAGSHPGDVGGMLRLLQFFGRVQVVQDALRTWSEANEGVVELQVLGQQLFAAVEARRDDDVQATLARIAAVDDSLTLLGRRFAERVSAASRLASTALMAATLLASAMLALLGLLTTRRLLRRIERASEALRGSERRLQLAIAASDHGIFDLDLRTEQLHVSPHVLAGLGLGDWPSSVSLGTLLAQMHPHDLDRVNQLLHSDCPHGTRRDFEFRLRGGDGQWRWLRACGSTFGESTSRQRRVAGALSDVTGRHAAEDRLATLEHRARDTLASIGDAVLTTDAGGAIDYVNPVAERLLGRDRRSLVGQPVAEVCRFIDDASDRTLPHPVLEALAFRATLRLPETAMLQRPDGHVLAIDATAATIGGADANGRPGVVLVLRDVSRERADAARLSYQASHDEVTGLLNRREFERRLGLAIEGARAQGEQHALMMIDLDQFKIVNDTCGHAAGDELLRQVATLLKQQLRDADSLGRLGGDEFGVLLGHCAPSPAARIAETLRHTLADFRFVASGKPFPISASIGLVHLDDAAIDRAGALSAADSACHVAKEFGRNRVHAYHVSDGELAARQDMMGWVTRIQEALDEDRLCLDAQPILPADPDRHEPAHVELLLRMVHRDGRLVAPMAFIPTAERYGLMPSIDRWVVRTAFARIAAEATPGVYAINLSGVSVGDERFLDVVRREQQRFGIDPSRICFEITETAAISNLDRAIHFMSTLRDMGFRFALDDFGAGMSSFGYLKHLPVDYLKIDGAFVKDMLSDPIDAAMVEAIHRIGQVMGMRTIAEFVDDPRVRERLAAIGVDFVQGFGVGRPQPFVRPASAPVHQALPRQA